MSKGELQAGAYLTHEFLCKTLCLLHDPRLAVYRTRLGAEHILTLAEAANSLKAIIEVTSSTETVVDDDPFGWKQIGETNEDQA